MRWYKRFFIFFLLFAACSCSAEKRREPPLTVVVFGATGDLSKRKLFPALSHLAEEGTLPERFALVGVGRRSYSHEDFRKEMGTSMQNRLFYAQVDFEKGEGYGGLAGLLQEIDRGFNEKSNRIYYLATPASHFSPIVSKLGEAELIYEPDSDKKWSRVMVEKPFGRDLNSAVLLQEELSKTLDESQIYRVDHYLAKEGVENLLAFRREGKFEPLWNKRYIERIEITLSEEMGIGSRGRFWEETGLLRDVFQNHLLQLLSLVASELPVHPEEKVALLQAVRPLSSEEVIRGQYGPGKGFLGYREEIQIPGPLRAETFVAAKLSIDHPRWEGVPFFIRAGKRLPESKTEIAIHFKKGLKPLVIRIQPNPEISWSGKVLSKFSPMPEAYETLFLDCIRGERSRFVEREEPLAAWRLVTPILEKWASEPPPFPNYEAGSLGPEEAIALFSVAKNQTAVVP